MQEILISENLRRYNINENSTGHVLILNYSRVEDG